MTQQYYIRPYAIYVCRYCGNSIVHSDEQSIPNLTCGPHQDENGGIFMTTMERVGPIKPVMRYRYPWATSA